MKKITKVFPGKPLIIVDREENCGQFGEDLRPTISYRVVDNKTGEDIDSGFMSRRSAVSTYPNAVNAIKKEKK